MTTRLYLHNAASSVSGTLPTTTQLSRTLTASMAAQTVNKSMDTTIGTSQTSVSLTRTPTASAFEQYYGTKFVSLPINQTSIATNNWTVNLALGTTQVPVGSFPLFGFPCTDAGAAGYVVFCIYVWRPSSGAKVGDIYLGASSEFDVTRRTSTGEFSAINQTTIAGSSLTIVVGDVLVTEVWSGVRTSSAASTTFSIYYDGTTVNTTNNTSVSNHASFIETPETIAFVSSAIDATPTSKTNTNKFITHYP